MNIWYRASWYTVIGSIIFMLDRILKMKALAACHDRIVMNQFLSFDLALNRGISWGIFYSSSTTVFVFISLCIGIITGIIAIFGIMRFLAGEMVIGELLVVVGSLSNLVDRLVYNGVIDFIELSYNGYVWPIFNGADVCIVCGIFIMMLEYYQL